MKELIDNLHWLLNKKWSTEKKKIKQPWKLLPDMFRLEAVSNCVIEKQITNQSDMKSNSIEAWCVWKPSIRHLKSFGCMLKVSETSDKCIIFDTSKNQNAKGKIIISHDVIFD